MANPRRDYLRLVMERRAADPDSSLTDSHLDSILEDLEKQSVYLPEPYDIVRVKNGLGELEYGMLLSVDLRNRTAAVAVFTPVQDAQPFRFIAALSDTAPATSEEAREYYAARGRAPSAGG